MTDSPSPRPTGHSQALTLRPLLAYWASRWRGRDWVRQLGILTLVACLLVILQPFGSFREPFAGRLVYWLAMLCVMVWGILPVLARSILKHGRGADLPVVPGALGLYLAASLPMTLIVGTLDLTFATARASVPGLPPADLSWGTLSLRLAYFMPTADGLGVYLMGLFAKVAAISLLSLGLITLVAAGRWTKAAQVPADPHRLRPGLKFFARLPASVGTALVLLRMEDHYVRVVTRDGQALILMRLSDAIAELADVPGLQVHRSWWVAVAEIQSVARKGKGLCLVMSEGTQVPVSSSFRAKVEALLNLDVPRAGPADSESFYSPG